MASYQRLRAPQHLEIKALRVGLQEIDPATYVLVEGHDLNWRPRDLFAPSRHIGVEERRHVPLISFDQVHPAGGCTDAGVDQDDAVHPTRSNLEVSECRR